jgi:hypothetical protein
MSWANDNEHQNQDIGIVSWIHLAQDKAQWWPLVDTVTNFLFNKRQGMLPLAQQLLASHGHKDIFSLLSLF